MHAVLQLYTVYDMFRFTVIMHEFCADVKLLEIILKKLRTTH